MPCESAIYSLRLKPRKFPKLSVTVSKLTFFFDRVIEIRTKTTSHTLTIRIQSPVFVKFTMIQHRSLIFLFRHSDRLPYLQEGNVGIWSPSSRNKLLQWTNSRFVFHAINIHFFLPLPSGCRLPNNRPRSDASSFCGIASHCTACGTNWSPGHCSALCSCYTASIQCAEEIRYMWLCKIECAKPCSLAFESFPPSRLSPAPALDAQKSRFLVPSCLQLNLGIFNVSLIVHWSKQLPLVESSPQRPALSNGHIAIKIPTPYAQFMYLTLI